MVAIGPKNRVDMPSDFLYRLTSPCSSHFAARLVTIITITATRRADRGVHSDSLDKALIGPLAQEAPAGFLFF